MASWSEAQGIDGGSFVQTSQPGWGFAEAENADEMFSARLVVALGRVRASGVSAW
jgi:hypothetical protein